MIVQRGNNMFHDSPHMLEVEWVFFSKTIVMFQNILNYIFNQLKILQISQFNQIIKFYQKTLYTYTKFWNGIKAFNMMVINKQQQQQKIVPKDDQKMNGSEESWCTSSSHLPSFSVQWFFLHDLSCMLLEPCFPPGRTRGDMPM